MSKINIRSPYHINTTAINLTSAKIDLYIYTGIQTTNRGTIIYSLESTAYNNQVTFEISEFVKDYLSIVFNGTHTPQNIFVDYQITQTIFDVTQTPGTIVQLTAFDGYGYFEQGINPVLSVPLLQSNSIVYNYEGATIKLPVDTSLTASVKFYLNATLLQTTTITSSALSTAQIQYVSFTGTINRVVVTDNVAAVTNLVVCNIEECKHQPYKITFVNKFGALQDLWFFKRSNSSITVTDERYKANIMSNGGYDIFKHQSRILTKSGTEKITLNSGFVDEQFNEVFRQLLLSEKVWLGIGGQTLPVNITSNSLDFKTQLNDKLINYTIELAYAFDKINNIR
jgi:hypothetical protein